MDLHEILFIIIRTSVFGVLLDFNKLRCEDNSMSFSFPKTLFITIRTSVLGVLLDFNKLRCEDNSMSFSFPKALVRVAL